MENLVAACDGGPTRVAARISCADQVPGAAFALQRGVDALLVPPALLEAALVAKAQRGERASAPSCPSGPSAIELIDLRDGGAGDCVCVDLTAPLEPGEGMLVGSSASSLVLVHGETVPSEFALRPFRVNAGAVHSYVLMADGSTRYLSELRLGDKVAILSSSGLQRAATVGRCKTKRRPLLLLRWRDPSGRESGTFLQQAESIRLVDAASSEPVAIAELKERVSLAGWCSGGGRHIGMAISSEVLEH